MIVRSQKKPYTPSRAYKQYPYKKIGPSQLKHRGGHSVSWVKRSEHTETKYSLTFEEYTYIVSAFFKELANAVLAGEMHTLPIGDLYIGKYKKRKPFLDFNKIKLHRKETGETKLFYHKDTTFGYNPFLKWLRKGTRYAKLHKIVPAKYLRKNIAGALRDKPAQIYFYRDI